MTVAAKAVTAEELLAMGEKGRWLELYEGELYAASPANARHGDIAGQIAMLLRYYAKPRNLGTVLVEGGFVLRRNPDTVLGPDVSFIAQSRVPPEGLPEKFFEGQPDLAVEIISPKNPRAEVERKMKLFLVHGTPLGWLVNPKSKTIEIHRPDKPVETLKDAKIISGEAVIPGFLTTVADIFA